MDEVNPPDDDPSIFVEREALISPEETGGGSGAPQTHSYAFLA